MKKILVFGLIIVLMVYLSGCGYFLDKPAEFGYQYADPVKAIEHYFEIELPEDTEFLEYEYEYDRKGASGIKAKISFSVDGLTAFSESMTEAGYISLSEDTEYAKEMLEYYQKLEKFRFEYTSWWNFDGEAGDGYHRRWGNRYIKGWYNTYIFVFNDGETVTVYMDLGS